MTTRRSFLSLGAALGASIGAALVMAAGPAAAQDSIAAAKSAGLVGERPDGLVGYVTDSVPANVRSLVEGVNDGRRKKYEEIARSTGRSLTEVQAVAGDRLIQETPSGQYVMNAAGRWSKK
ncbi:MAG TPA: YdbL family protein [Azospirillaceae bacterium]|nr:YdbL family protein [Azospirillaceae bacterium]